MIRDATMHRLGTSPNLESDFRGLIERLDEPAWVGYAVPMVDGQHRLCCAGAGLRPRVCLLEGTRGNQYNSEEYEGRSIGTLMVMIRLAGGQATRIRTFSLDCELDAGGMPVYWWSKVDPRQSLDLLQSLVARASSSHVAEAAVQAIAHHAHPRADMLLEELARGEEDKDIAEKAVFWMGAVRAQAGLESLRRLIESTRDTELREQITFALYLSSASEATRELINMARRDNHRDVRGKALFWLGQKAGQLAARTIVEAVQDDPDLEIKKKAVFALSQLPSDEGVPLLIEVARSHPQPEVRERAMFWLGQSGDRRALAFFEEILLKR